MFDRLFAPIAIGPVTVRNRILSTGHATGYAEDGQPGDRELAYNVAKARGGAGLIVFGGTTSVHRQSPARGLHLIANRDDSIIPAYRRLADAVHSEGATLFTQLTHYGRHSHSDTEDWLPLVAPSQVPGRFRRELPHELDVDAIGEIVVAFGQAARRCREGGLDGVELSASHNHLLDQFWSPRTNRRDDAYGGSRERRVRFSLEVLAEVRSAVGRDYPVGIRMSADERVADGLGTDDLRWIAEAIAASRLVDFLDVTGGSAETNRALAEMTPDASFPTATHATAVAAVRAAVDVPVFYAGRVIDPRQAETLLADGVCDMVGMTRALIADPELPAKARAGRVASIRPCVGANVCIDRLYGGGDVICVHNPATGRERALGPIARSATRRRVLVVGAGPAGLESARVAALRGHEVVLVEAGEQPGGQLLALARTPGYEDFGGIVRWLVDEVRGAGVDVRTATTASVASVQALAADAVIVATGARPWRPDVPGIDQPHVATAEDVLLGASRGRNAVVIADGGPGRAATSAALRVLADGADVELVTPLRHVDDGLGDTTFPVVYERLLAEGARMTPGLRLTAIVASGVELTCVHTGRTERRTGIDLVVLATGTRSDDRLHRDLLTAGIAATLVGDAVAPRGTHFAILEGTRAARGL
jgi:2,4-dienoyl-CoA reductase-like NADH-dependent reductase (Old Yellow Enzyme family)/thioredoxin reductase